MATDYLPVNPGRIEVPEHYPPKVILARIGALVVERTKWLALRRRLSRAYCSTEFMEPMLRDLNSELSMLRHYHAKHLRRSA